MASYTLPYYNEQITVKATQISIDNLTFISNDFRGTFIFCYFLLASNLIIKLKNDDATVPQRQFNLIKNVHLFEVIFKL